MNGPAIAFAAALLVVVAAIAVHQLTTTGLEHVEAPSSGGPAGEGRPERSHGMLDLLGARLVGPLTKALGARRMTELDAAIRRAGRPDGITPTVFVRRQAGFVVLGAVCLAALWYLGSLFMGVMLAALLCAWMPLWLWGVGVRRQHAIDAELPDFLDVLGVTVRAGLGFRASLGRVCEFSDGPLAQEIRAALHEMSLGVPRRRVFEDLRDRTRSEAFGNFVAALLQAEELGVPMSDALTDIAADVRRDHAQKVRQQAAKAGPKVSLAVTVTIVPGALVLLVSAVLLGNASLFDGLL
ncbi:type II secretion system F family protein [Sanguibacter antarcticus]|uniref:Tight adherence protein C n=1 Tax=Sanguibacter antarcticus TaxID=372484 RepID=A0A2A9E7Q7_9MICO|nr:type II secretion system F family protein [Sanguibacter antarcticus]PFG34686.1 tight adherence protein C [Sanguibacter antarcticus]